MKKDPHILVQTHLAAQLTSKGQLLTDIGNKETKKRILVGACFISSLVMGIVNYSVPFINIPTTGGEV